jgi:hypothetical protein
MPPYKGMKLTKPGQLRQLRSLSPMLIPLALIIMVGDYSIIREYETLLFEG